jgi:hypothetical protein
MTRLTVDAQASIVGDGGLQEGERAFLFLVGEDLSRGDAGMVVDRHMDELPSGRPVALLPMTSRVMRWPVRWKRPSFLMSMWMISPGEARS